MAGAKLLSTFHTCVAEVCNRAQVGSDSGSCTVSIFPEVRQIPSPAAGPLPTAPHHVCQSLAAEGTRSLSKMWSCHSEQVQTATQQARR